MSGVKKSGKGTRGMGGGKSIKSIVEEAAQNPKVSEFMNEIKDFKRETRKMLRELDKYQKQFMKEHGYDDIERMYNGRTLQHDFDRQTFRENYNRIIQNASYSDTTIYIIYKDGSIVHVNGGNATREEVNSIKTNNIAYVSIQDAWDSRDSLGYNSGESKWSKIDSDDELRADYDDEVYRYYKRAASAGRKRKKK